GRVKLVSSSNWSRPAPMPARRLYFVHIPKTAGVTFKAFLENNTPNGEALVVDEWDARRLTSVELGGYTLYSGHYASEVLEALPAPPDVTLMLLREPVARFKSWWAHCLRLTGDHRYRDMLLGRTQTDVLGTTSSGPCTQAHWLARALAHGSTYHGVPTRAEALRLLDRIHLVGLTEEIDRFQQLVAYRLDWPVPTLGWRINVRPDIDGADDGRADETLRNQLVVDLALYQSAAGRFWRDYAEMLSAIN